MSLKDIFRDKRAEAARQEGRQEGRDEERKLAIQADKERFSGESIDQAMDRLRESNRS